MVFGVPSVVISIVCYALCCMEPIDDGSYDGEDDEDEREYGDLAKTWYLDVEHTYTPNKCMLYTNEWEC